MAEHSHLRLKLTVLEGYGGRCACCGETNAVFLSLDHIQGGGHRDRKTRGNRRLYRELRDTEFPTGQYQVLCHNCNMAKRDALVCPCASGRQTVTEALAALPIPNPARGQSIGSGKLTIYRVMQLRALAAQGVSWAELGRMFGVAQGNAQAAATGRTWAHVPGAVLS